MTTSVSSSTTTTNIVPTSTRNTNNDANNNNNANNNNANNNNNSIITNVLNENIDKRIKEFTIEILKTGNTDNYGWMNMNKLKENLSKKYNIEITRDNNILFEKSLEEMKEIEIDDKYDPKLKYVRVRRDKSRKVIYKLLNCN